MGKVVTKILYAGPHDGEEVEIHEDNLKYFPIISVENDEGESSTYTVNDEQEFVWVPDPSKLKPRGVVCDDDGNVISEVSSVEDAFELLDEMERKAKEESEGES